MTLGNTQDRKYIASTCMYGKGVLRLRLMLAEQNTRPGLCPALAVLLSEIMNLLLLDKSISLLCF